MFIGFIIVVVLGNLVCGQNGTEFIDTLPENEKTDLLEKIGDRISKEVHVSRKSNASDVEVSDAQMNEFDGLVNKILNEEKSKVKQKLIIKETQDILPTGTKFSNLPNNVKEIIEKVAKTQKSKLESKNDSKGDSKIITIPFRLHDTAVVYSKSQENIENTTSTHNSNINVSTEKEPIMNNITSDVSENSSPKLVETNVTRIVARKSNEFKVENNVKTTIDHISVPTVTSPMMENVIITTQNSIVNDTLIPLKVDKEAVNTETTDTTGTSPITESVILTTTQNSIPNYTISPLKIDKEEGDAKPIVNTTIQENVIITTTQNIIPKDSSLGLGQDDNENEMTANTETIVTTPITKSDSITTQKSIPIDTSMSLKSGRDKGKENSNSEERMKLDKDQEVTFADEANIMNQLFYESTENPIDILINDTIGESGEKTYYVDESNTTKQINNEHIVKYRRHINKLGKQDILLQPSRRAGSNETYLSVGHHKHPWSQDQRNQYLRNSTLNNTVNLTNSVNVSSLKNNNEMSLNKSENITSLSNNAQPQINDKNSQQSSNTSTVKPEKDVKINKKPKKKIDRQSIDYIPYSDETLPDTSWPEYPNVNEQLNSLNSWSQQIHNTSSESLETLEDLLTNTDDNEDDLLEDIHTYTRPKNTASYKHKTFNDVASTSFTLTDETTPKFIPTNTQTIKIPIYKPNLEENKKESVENNRFKLITEVSTPLNKPNPSNKTIIPSGLVESLAYPKIKKKNKKKRKPLKLHITSGQNPVDIRIIYDKNYKERKNLKITISRDNVDYSYTIPNNNNNHNFKSTWPRRNFGDNRQLYVSDFFPKNDLEYTTLPSYLSYVPPLSYRPSYYKPEIPFTLFTKRAKVKEDPRNIANAGNIQKKYMFDNGDDHKYFAQVEDPNKPPELEIYKGQLYNGETQKLTSQKILQEINKFLSPQVKNRYQKVAGRNDKYLYKNPARCQFKKSGRSKNGYENDSESDCRSSEENDDIEPASVKEASDETPTLITLIAVMSKHKPKVDVEEKEELNLNKPKYTANAYPYKKKVKKVSFKNVKKPDLLGPPTDIYKKQQQMYNKEAIADVINSQFHVEKNDKVMERGCPKQYDIEIYVETIGMLILTEDDALRKFDWLSSTIDIQGAIQKLLVLSNKVTNNEKIHSADLELLKFVIYLRKLAVQRGLEREACKAHKKLVPTQKPDFKVMQKADWMLHGRTKHNKPQMNRELYKYYNNQNNDNTEVLDFISFLNVLQTELYDLHSVIKQISGVTKYNNQNWFGDIKNLYLDYANRQDLLGVLLHLSLTKIIDYIEASANKGLTYNYVQYVIDHQEEIINMVDEFDFCSILTNEMEKNIYMN